MRRSILALALAFGCAGVGFAAGKKVADGKAITLKTEPETHVVPAGKFWKVEGLMPYESKKGVGTSDFDVEGTIYVGKEQDVVIYGKLEINISERQNTPIWIREGAKVEVGDSRGEMTVREFTE